MYKGTLKYGGTPDDAMSLCYSSNNDSIAHVHIFGVEPTGPYGPASRFDAKNDPFIDTKVRIQFALDSYFNYVGKQDYVYIV